MTLRASIGVGSRNNLLYASLSFIFRPTVAALPRCCEGIHMDDGAGKVGKIYFWTRDGSDS